MNKFRSILVTCFILLLITLHNCGNRNKQIITIWHSMRPLETSILQEQLKKFAVSYPDWEFRELFYANETARTNFIISALGGSGPDLFWGANDNIGPFVELEIIRPLETLVPDSFLNQFIEEPIEANTWHKDHLYQIADRVGNHLCLVYNKSLIQTPPQTISELKRIGKKLTRDFDGDNRPDQYALAWNYTEPFFAVPFIGGYGGWIIDENNNPTLNTEATIKAAQLIYDLANVDKIIPIECDYEVANALFKDGRSAMIINGPWSWGTYIDNGIDIGITRIPMIDETGIWASPVVSPLGYSINVNTKNRKLEITIELLKFLTSPEVELEFTKAMATIPSRKEAFNDPVVTSNQFVQSSIYQLEVGKLMPVVTELRWIWDAMRPSYQGIFTGRVKPEEAALSMQVLAENLIKENR
ncbi:extracellular solute-binding protein [candidate division KSB1 bacterium]|nr:extracellular solute-binding protein [candidate division KSB1 bacterium]